MFSVSGISVIYPGKDLFKSISFIINPRDRIGLVGKNGSGKTTLLNIIAGFKNADTGNVVIPEGKTIGYLTQELKALQESTVYNETLGAFSEVIILEKEIEDLEDFITHNKDFESNEYLKALEKLHLKYDRFNYLDGNKRSINIEKVLKGLGFREADFNRKMSEFSGGWQMRVELAKILLRKPDLILLDEPTNHLDIESILWLEDFLVSYPGAIVMVSHDKMFLENICKRTIEIVFGRIYDYPVKYSEFISLREERYESQIATARNQEKFIEQQERFIKRFRAKSTKARQVQSKIKMLEKIERVEIDTFDNVSIRFDFPSAPKSGKVVIQAEDLIKKYGNHTVLKHLNFTIEQTDRIAFVGRNGEGKTTLVKVINGEEPYDGKLVTGYNVISGYYAQVQERTLDENNTVIGTLEDIAGEEWNNTRIRSLLGTFLFTDKDIDKKIKVLSGGEKSRLALAKLLLRPSNFLILDEPTNHLDISAKDVLKKALANYKGTLILVSHDRDFLEGLTTKTFEFKNKGIQEHLGGIDEFLRKHRVESFRDFEQIKKISTQAVVNEPRYDKKEKYLLKKETDKEYKKLQKELKSVEHKIEETEIKIRELELLMQTPEFYQNQLVARETSENHKELQTKLERLLEDWEKSNHAVDEFENRSSAFKTL